MCYTFFRRILVLSLFTITAFLLHLNAATITGEVIDVSDNSPLSESTIRLLSARDSAYVNGTASDLNGKFKISNVSNGRYILSISYIGYGTLKKNIRVTDETPNIALGKISLKENTIMLKEATVVGVKTEIKVKEDTVEFNADSYKTQPNAVVEDLLKRLPGVQIGSDGKITSNGKEVTKILVDGKEFFADDPTVATKNIPVNIVDKLQVVDRKSDLARITGVDDGEDETVINLTVKKGMNNGWFGNANAGYGTDKRYAGNFTVNKFWNGNQLTILGNANNINSLGFNDGNSGRFRMFGGDNGVTKSQSLGINFNVGKSDSLRVGGSIMYSHSDKNSIQRVNRQYLFTDSTSYYNSGSNARDKGHNLRGDFRLQWKIDSLNTIDFRPNFSININNSEQADSSFTRAGNIARTLVNKSQNLYSSDGHSFTLGGQLIYNHNFRQKRGRSFSLQLRYNLSNVREKGTTYTQNTYYLLDKEDITNQYSDNHTWSNNVNGRITWTEPLGNVKNGRFLTFAYSAQYNFSNADKFVYDLPTTSTGTTTTTSTGSETSSMAGTSKFADYLMMFHTAEVYNNPELFAAVMSAESDGTLNNDLSNQFRNDFFSQRFQVGFKQVKKTYTVDFGLSLNPSMSKSENLINDAKSIPTRWVWNVAPYLRYRYKMGKSRNLNVDYRANSSQPSMSQLQPVADKSNPLRIVIGNPELKPTFTNYVRLRFSDFNQASQRSIMAMADAQFASNSIVSKTSYDSQTGGQTTTYENVNGVWNAMAMGMISFPFHNKHWQFTNNLFTRYANAIGYINGEHNRSGSFSVNESVSLAYRTDVIEIEARPYYSLQTTTNTVQTSSTPTVHTYGGTLTGSYYFPFGLSFNTDITYTGTIGYAEGYNKNQWLWNATLSYQFLRQKAATLSVKVYDILKQQQNISRTVSASYIDDTEYNTLTRYAMVSFAYKFSTFAGGKNPESKYEDFNRRYGPPGERPSGSGSRSSSRSGGGTPPPPPGI